MENVSDETRKRWSRQSSTILKAHTGKPRLIQLSEWEINFVFSMSVQLEQGRDLTFKQSSALGRIYARIQ